MRPLCALSWDDKKKAHASLAGLVGVAAVAFIGGLAATAAPSGAAGSPPPGITAQPLGLSWSGANVALASWQPPGTDGLSWSGLTSPGGAPPPGGVAPDGVSWS